MTSLPRSLRRTTVALATALLAACASTGGLAPQDAPMHAGDVAAARSLSGAHLANAQWPTLRWWTAFGDPQLDALVAEGLAGSPSIEAADARTRKAVAQAGLADALRKPTLGASTQVLGLQIPETLAPEPIGGEFSTAWIFALDFKYSPDLWGGKRAKWESALGAARAQDVDAQAARVTLAANIARTYIALAQAFEMQDVANAEAARSDRLLALSRQRAKAGIDNAIAVGQNASNEATARQQAEAAQQQIDALRNALAALVGKGPDRGLDIARPRLHAEAAVALPPVLPSDLLARRADVVSALWRVQAAQRGIDASKADFYPTINLAAMVGLAAGNLGDLFGSKALLVNGGPALSLPILDGGRLRNQLAASDADYDLAVAGYNQALLGALREVADAVQSARSLDAQLAHAVTARDQAQRAFELAALRYKAGLANQLDVLNARKPLLLLDQQVAILRAHRASAAVDLDQALGGGVPASLLPLPETASTLLSTPPSATTP
jgi:NodT family efflux transporter outer membrane factor (OMF) lipoprotein